jgi:hypothetical protein
VTEPGELAEIRENVAAVLKPEAFYWWYETARIPALGNRTPFQIISDGDIEKLRSHTATYSDTNFT